MSLQALVNYVHDMRTYGGHIDNYNYYVLYIYYQYL